MDNEMKDAGVYLGTLLALSISLTGAILLLANRNYDGLLEYVLILTGFILSVALYRRLSSPWWAQARNRSTQKGTTK